MTGIRIPDTEGVSGAFAALERTSPIVQVAVDGVPTTTSMRVANGTNVQHKNVLEMVRANVADFEEFGRVAFETRPFDTAGGPQAQTVAILNEEHATLLLTYMRNNDIVRDFKKRLVREFSALRRQSSTMPAAMPSHAEALRGWAEQLERAEAAESRARELAVPAIAYQELVDAEGDYSVADAAKVLSRDPAINIRERKLFEFMADQGWVFRRGGRWKAYRSQLDTGRLAEKAGRPFKIGERLVNAEPTVRVTPKGLADLRHLLADEAEGGQLALVAVQ